MTNTHNKRSSKRMSRTSVTLRGATQVTNTEAATRGTAAVAVNVREAEQSLQVVGEPTPVGSIATGQQLWLVTDDYQVSADGHTVVVNGEAVATVAGDIVGVHKIGQYLVVVTTQGLTTLVSNGTSWTELDPTDAPPVIALTARYGSSSTEVGACTFDEPYSEWQALHADDETTLQRLLRTAWQELTSEIVASGNYYAPILVCYAVRLYDDSYLWVSDPIRLGDDTLANTDWLQAAVNSDSSGFTGTTATTLALQHYSVGIEVSQGVGNAWQSQVKSIDIYATSAASLLTTARALHYRCVSSSTNPRTYSLQMRLSPNSEEAIARELAASTWTMIATATDVTSLSETSFKSPTSVVTLTNSQIEAINSSLQVVGDQVCSTAAGGRLYCCSTSGEVMVTWPGNPFVEAHRSVVLGCTPRAMSVVIKPLYSGGFGRYAVYVFTNDGIFAIPQSTAGTLGEARLVDRAIIATGTRPVEGDNGNIYFVSRHQQLCRLQASRVTTVLRQVAISQLAWSDAYGELWMLDNEGQAQVLQASGTTSQRTMQLSQLYCDPRHALAVSTQGDLLDLEHEQAASMTVSYQSHPIGLDALMAQVVHRLVWRLTGDELQLALCLTGQRDIGLGDSYTLCQVTVNGACHTPLAIPLLHRPARTVCLWVTGTASSGTLLLPVTLDHYDPR